MSLPRNIIGGLAAALTLSFVSCVEQDPGEDFLDPMATSPETDIASLMPNSVPTTITTLPRYRLDNENIIDMPDGVHLRPGVKIHKVPEELTEYVFRDPDNFSVFHATGLAVDFLKTADEFDAVFFGETGFTVESAHRDGSEIIFETRPFRFVDAIYGNFRITFEVPLEQLTDTRTGEVIPPQAPREPTSSSSDPYNTRKEQLVLFQWTDESIPKSQTVGNVSLSATNKMSFQTSTTVEGVFEGQISYVNRAYTCKNPDERGWFDGTTFCVDRLAVYFEMGADAKIESSLTATGRLTVTDELYEKTFRKFQVPVGATGISLYVEPYIKVLAEYGFTASGTVGFKWEANPRIPLGFEYINNASYQRLPGNPADGTYIIPNRRYPFRLNSSGLNWDTPQGDAGIVFEPSIQAGVNFGGCAGGVICIKGASFYLETKMAMQARLVQSAPRNKPCLEAELSMNAIAEPDITFEIDARIKSWEFQLLCGKGGNANCAKLDSGNLLQIFGMPENKRKWTSNSGCSTGTFNTLKLTRTSTTPAGRFDIAGYEVDGIALTYSTGTGLAAASYTTYATTGPSKARGAPDANCDNLGSKVHGIVGSNTFRFNRDIQTGNTITIVQIKDKSGGCRGSGTVSVSISGSGVAERNLGTIAQNGSVAFQ